MTTLRLSLLVVLAAGGTAVADPAPSAPPPPAQATSVPAPRTLAAALAQPLVLTPLPLFDLPTPVTEPSVRIDAARMVAERFAQDWRFAEPGTLLGVNGGMLYMGDGYRPRSRRAAALNAGAIGATLLGEILLGSGSPLAGAAALITGATLDAAGADADRDAEARGR